MPFAVPSVHHKMLLGTAPRRCLCWLSAMTHVAVPGMAQSTGDRVPATGIGPSFRRDAFIHLKNRRMGMRWSITPHWTMCSSQSAARPSPSPSSSEVSPVRGQSPTVLCRTPSCAHARPCLSTGGWASGRFSSLCPHICNARGGWGENVPSGAHFAPCFEGIQFKPRSMCPLFAQVSFPPIRGGLAADLEIISDDTWQITFDDIQQYLGPFCVATKAFPRDPPEIRQWQITYLDEELRILRAKNIRAPEVYIFVLKREEAARFVLGA